MQYANNNENEKPKKLYANNIATAMEMLTDNISWEIIFQQTGVNPTHHGIAIEFGFDVYPLSEVKP